MRAMQRTGSDGWSFTERWMAESLDVTPLSEADRQQVVQGIRQVYRSRRVPWPDHVIWVRSPFDLENHLLDPVALAEQRLKGPAGQAVIRRQRRSRIVSLALNALWTLGFIMSAILLFAVLRWTKVFALFALIVVAAGGAYAAISGSGAAGWLSFAALLGFSTWLLLSLRILFDQGLEELAEGGPALTVGLLKPISVKPAPKRERPLPDEAGRTAATIEQSVWVNVGSLWENFWTVQQNPRVMGSAAVGSTPTYSRTSIFTFTRETNHSLPGRIWALESGLWKPRRKQRELLEGLNATRRAVGWVGYRTIVVICEPPVELHTEQVNSRHRLHNASGPAVAWAGSSVGNMYFHHGHALPSRLGSSDVSIADLHAERDSGFRWTAIARMGWLRYLEEAGSVLVGTALDPADDTVEHQLHELAEGYPGSGRLLLTMGRAGPTGDRSAYGYLVPATTEDPIEALAWLYNLRAQEYQRFAWSGRGDLLLFEITRGALLDQVPRVGNLPETGLELENPEVSRGSWWLLPGDDATGIVWTPNLDWEMRDSGYLLVPVGRSVNVLHRGEPVGPTIGPGHYAVRQKCREHCQGRDAH